MAPRQARPSQPSPVQVAPRQARPCQMSPPLTPLAYCRGSQALPKTSTSPRSSLTPSETCELPRAASSDPVPVLKKVAGCLVLVTSFCWARRAWPTPLPRYWLEVESNASAVVISCRLTWSGVSRGFSCSSRATSPLTTAAACEVPEALANRVPTRAVGWRSSA